MKSDRFLKQTRIETHAGFGIHINSTGQGATPAEYLDRLATVNRIFNDDVRIERVLKLGGTLSVVTSQPRITGRAATPEEITNDAGAGLRANRSGRTIMRVRSCWRTTCTRGMPSSARAARCRSIPGSSAARPSSGSFCDEIRT